MSTIKYACKLTVLISSLIFGGLIQADDSRAVYGTLDDFSKNEIVVSDRVLSVSKLVSCRDLRGETIVGCNRMGRAKWVEVIIQSNNQVIQIREITKTDYLRAKNSDD